MSDILSPHHVPPGFSKRERRWTTPLGAVFVLLALIIALSSFLIFAGYTPVAVSDHIVLGLFIANIASIFLLFGLVLVEAYRLYAAWRSKVAGAGLHLRIVTLFSIVAAAPALLMAWVGSVTLERSLNPSFMQDVRGFVLNTIDAARLFREGQCKALLQEALLTAADLDRAKTILFENHRELFRDFFASRARFLGFTAAALMNSKGEVIERIDTHAKVGTAIVKPEPSDFADARKNEPLCLILDEGATFVALRPVASFTDTFLYVARPVDPFSVAFPREASKLVALYDAFDSHRRSIQLAFAAMFVSIALIMLLAATWLGLSFANQLVAPIRRLITATDQVASGNLSVQVAVYRDEGDLARLGETFNKMIAELRLQQNRLIAASNLIDERRLFTEAVLSGVPVAVVGVGPKGQVTVLNASAEKLMPAGAEELAPVTGQPVETVLPEITSLLNEARASSLRLMQGQISLDRGGRDRLFNISITSEPTARSDKGYVVTLDDITDLVTAQRTAAWADVARRIAHEIKNPLTPIQLSAERLKRKYGRLITQDRDIFDQCVDTIVRQVDDIKRMVDEFSSFARMPKAKLESDNLSDCLRRVLFLMRVAHPDIVFDEDMPEEPVMGYFDRRLLSQAVTNILKNATEGIAAAEAEASIENAEPGTSAEASSVKPRPPGRILLKLRVTRDEALPDDATRERAEIEIIDNGKGFPRENRNRLLEPYMTTRAEGTGLGLPIVAKILEDHGGSLQLLDAPEGPGACVRLIVPIGAEMATRAALVSSLG